MKAVRVRNRREGAGHHKCHWLRDGDPGKTVCGLRVETFVDCEQVDLETLPSVEGCFACERALAGYKKKSPSAEQRVTLQPSLGRFSRQHGWHRIVR